MSYPFVRGYPPHYPQLGAPIQWVPAPPQSMVMGGYPQQLMGQPAGFVGQVPRYQQPVQVAGPRRRRMYARRRCGNQGHHRPQPFQRFRRPSAAPGSVMVPSGQVLTAEPSSQQVAPEVEQGLVSGTPNMGQPVPVGPHLQVQAERGSRAVIVPIGNDMWVVKRVPENAVGSIALALAPMVLKAATQALTRPGPGGTPSLADRATAELANAAVHNAGRFRQNSQDPSLMDFEGPSPFYY